MRHVATIVNFGEIDLGTRSLVLSDLDGCLISGRHVHNGARAFVEACGERLWIVSNNSADTAETLAERLAEMGLEIAPQRILLAGEQSVRALARHPAGRRAAIYADAPLRALARRLGIAGEVDSPELVLVGRDQRFGLALCEQIAAQIVDGATVWATNLDRSHPSPAGRPVPETGAMLAAIEAMCGPLTVHSIGKPAPDLIELALKRSGAERSHALFVGDNAATDGEAARAAGIDFIRIDHPVAARVKRAVAAVHEAVAC